MKELKQSETIVIKRSQINLNPFNPKKHSDKEVKNQLKNLKKVGFNGGIKWNKISGNLIDGHRRIKAMDIYFKYNGTDEKDYSVKVEQVAFDDKTEKEQMTYEALGNTKADYSLVADYVSEIDLKQIGISDEDVTAITSYLDNEIPLADPIEIPEFEELDNQLKSEEKKEAVKQMKEDIKEKAIERQKDEEAYITLSFSSFKAKSIFCELLNIPQYERFAKGEDVLRIIE